MSPISGHYISIRSRPQSCSCRQDKGQTSTKRDRRDSKDSFKWKVTRVMMFWICQSAAVSNRVYLLTERLSRVCWLTAACCRPESPDRVWDDLMLTWSADSSRMKRIISCSLRQKSSKWAPAQSIPTGEFCSERTQESQLPHGITENRPEDILLWLS